MRRTRWLIVLAFLLVLGGSGVVYLKQQYSVRKNAPARPITLGDDNMKAQNFEWAQTTNGKTNVAVKADRFREIGKTADYELEGVEIHFFQKGGAYFDLVKSAKAMFNQGAGHMFSEGAVEITLNVPVVGKPQHTLTSIKSSGVTFDSKTGKAVTDRATEFTFENGDGHCTGAVYDPAVHELHLIHDAEMNLRGKGPKSKAMKVQAGEITYREVGSTVVLSPWSRMIRAETTIEAATSTIVLKDEVLSSIDSEKAHGVDRYPKRMLQYSADALHVAYDEDGEVRKVTGTGNAKLHSESEGAVTETTSRTADMDFSPTEGESTLTHVLANGGAVIESRPARDTKGRMAETRVLRSETVEIVMRPGGKEIDHLQTLVPGVLEFVPNAADEHRRLLNGDRMTIGYGPKNSIRSFETVNAKTVTYPSANSRVKNAQPGKTASVNMTAAFDPATGQLASMKQWDHFTYEEGERRAVAETATLDNANSLIDLVTRARVWDAAGSTDADKIHLNQKTGDYIADGHVATSQQPEQSKDPKKAKGGELLEGDEPIQGTAPRMTSANRNKLVHYEGGSVVWQGADRVQGETIDIDRDKHTLTAVGHVTTTMVDKAEAESRAPAKQDVPAVYTIVTADKLVYTETDRLAHYTGETVLTRPALTVESAELRAFLNEKDSKAASRLNHAVADSKVSIVDRRPDRTRTGHGDRGEYYTDEDKIILLGNQADLVDSVKGDSHGAQLTYFTADDRLLISGVPSRPVKSTLIRKKHTNANARNH